MGVERQRAVSERPPRVYEHPLFTYVNDQRALSASGRTVHLTRRESQLIYVLSSVPNEAVSCQYFFRWVTGSDFVALSDEKNFRVIISHLRSKLNDLIGDCDVIKTVRYAGCMLVDESRPVPQEPTASLRKKLSEPIYLRVRNGFTG